MYRKPSKSSQLYHQMRLHNTMMTEADEANNQPVYDYHRQKWEDARAAYVALQDKLAARKQPPAAVTEAARQRWRHYGASGQLSMARICVNMMQGLPTISQEAKALAIDIEQKLDQLIWLMRERKEPTLPPSTP